MLYTVDEIHFAFLFSEVTKNIDVTIAHLIDGTILYSPLSDEDQKAEEKIIGEQKKSLNKKVFFLQFVSKFAPS